MKQTLSLLLLLAATMFSTALHAQGHFDWVKSYNGVPDYNHRTDVNTIVGSVADSDGNLYILGEFTPGAQIDGTDLLPFAPYGSDCRTQGVVIAKLSPDGQLLWHKSINTNYGALAAGVGIQIVGDTSIVCMAAITLSGERPQNYIYYLDTLFTETKDFVFPTDSIYSGSGQVYLEFDFDGQLKEQWFLSAACIRDSGVMMRDSSRYQDYQFPCNAFTIDGDGNIIVAVTLGLGPYLFEDSTFTGYRVLINGGERHFDIPVSPSRSSINNCQILKFSPHFSTLLHNQTLFEPCDFRGVYARPKSIMSSAVDNSIYLLFTMLEVPNSIDFKIVGLPGISILTNNSTEYSFQIKYDSLLNPQWLFQLDHEFTSSDSSTDKSYMMYAQSLDEDGDVYCLGWIRDLANYPINLYADTFSINVRNGDFFVRLDSDSGHALSVGEVRSSGRSLFNGLHAYMMVTHNNYVIAQLLYQGDIYMRDSTITNPFPNHWSTGLYVWDKEGHEVEFIDYLSSGGADGDPRSVTLHDSILYLSGQLAGGGTFGDHTLTEGYRAFIAKYVDPAFMTPYVYKDTTGNGGGNGGNGNGGDTNDVRIVMAEDGNAFVAYPNPFRQRVNIEYSGRQPITAAYLTDIMGRTEQVVLSATTPGRYTLDLTARPQAAYLLTLVTQDGHRHTVRLLKQSEVFGN